MPTTENLYESWTIKGSYFNRMLHCGFSANGWIQHALTCYLPMEILEVNKENLAFISTAEADAFRLVLQIRERECIIISERVLPKSKEENSPDVRYFIFLVLHEIAHAISKHRSPLLDELSADEILSQEEEADFLAITWFNNFSKKFSEEIFPPITNSEIEEMQCIYQSAMSNG